MTGNQIESQSLQSIDLGIPSIPLSRPPGVITPQSNSPIQCQGEEVVPNDPIESLESDNSNFHSASSYNKETEKSSNGGGNVVTPKVIDSRGKIIIMFVYTELTYTSFS